MSQTLVRAADRGESTKNRPRRRGMTGHSQRTTSSAAGSETSAASGRALISGGKARPTRTSPAGAPSARVKTSGRRPSRSLARRTSGATSTRIPLADRAAMTASTMAARTSSASTAIAMGSRPGFSPPIAASGSATRPNSQSRRWRGARRMVTSAARPRARGFGRPPRPDRGPRFQIPAAAPGDAPAPVGQRPHIVRRDEIAAGERGIGAAGQEQRLRRARTGADQHALVLARRADDIDEVGDEFLAHGDVLRASGAARPGPPR